MYHLRTASTSSKSHFKNQFDDKVANILFIMDLIHFLFLILLGFYSLDKVNTIAGGNKNRISEKENQHCVCVPYWQCKEDYSGLVEDGGEVMDIRYRIYSFFLLISK